jgi:hypothetical protein
VYINSRKFSLKCKLPGVTKFRDGSSIYYEQRG